MKHDSRTILRCAAALASAVLFGAAGAASAVETIRLTMSSSHPTTIPWVGALKTHVIAESNKRLEAAKSNYRIQWNEAFGGVLYNFNNTLEPIAQGVSDMGWVGALWEPAKLPLQNIMFATPFVTSDEEIAVDVMNKMTDTIPAMQAEWTRHNLVFLGATVSDTYHLFTKFPIKSLDDLKGRKIVAGTAHATWLKAIGATPVAAGLPAYYQMLQTGVADGTLIISTGAHSFKLYEVAPFITLVDLGVTTIGGLAVNGNTWKKLPPDVREVLGKLGREVLNRSRQGGQGAREGLHRRHGGRRVQDQLAVDRRPPALDRRHGQCQQGIRRGEYRAGRASGRHHEDLHDRNAGPRRETAAQLGRGSLTSFPPAARRARPVS